MKNIILENWGMQDIPDDLENILKYQFQENREYWTQFEWAFHKENREETLKRLATFESGDNIICQTTLTSWWQFELMIELFYSFIEKNIKLNFYIFIYGQFRNHIGRYIVEDFGRFKTKEKKERNQNIKKLYAVLKFHNIIEMDYETRWKAKDDRFKDHLIRVTKKMILDDFVFFEGQMIKVKKTGEIYEVDWQSHSDNSVFVKGTKYVTSFDFDEIEKLNVPIKKAPKRIKFNKVFLAKEINKYLIDVLKINDHFICTASNIRKTRYTPDQYESGACRIYARVNSNNSDSSIEFMMFDTFEDSENLINNNYQLNFRYKLGAYEIYFEQKRNIC